MRLLRAPARTPADVPHGARIVHADGSVSPCTLVADPQPGPAGEVRWLAEPPDGVVLGVRDALVLDYVPAGLFTVTVKCEGV